MGMLASLPGLVKKPWGLAGIVGVTHMAILGLVSSLWMPQRAHEFVRDGAALILPLMTFPFALRGATRFSLLLVSIPALALLGQAVWLVERYGLLQTAEPSIAAPVWLAAYALVVVAAFKWPVQPCRNCGFGDFLDTLIIGCGVSAVGWVYVMGPRLIPDSPHLSATLSSVYFGLLGLLAIALTRILRRGVHPAFYTASFLALIAVGIGAVSDFFPVTPQLTGFIDDLAVISWSLSVSLAGVVAYAYTLDLKQSADSDGSTISPVWREQVPYFAIVPVGCLLLQISNEPTLHPYEYGVQVSAVLLVVALGLRQYMALRENALLIGNIQSAKEALSERNDELSRTQDDLTELLQRLQSKNEELAQANEQLARLVTVDGMTGLGNHRAFHERLRLEADAARRFGHPVAVVIADIDRFSAYNGEFGHPAGDELLRQVAKVFLDSVDLNAYPARYGGEEFAVVLPYVSANDAIAIAHKIAAGCQRLTTKRPITLSFGISGSEGNHHAGDMLVQEAFRALEAAKNRGRNLIVLSDDLERKSLTLSLGGKDLSTHEPDEPMGLAAIISAALRSHPQALTLEPEAQLVSGLLGTLELKDLETRDHSERVMWYALRLAQSVMETDVAKMTQQDLRSLAYGALLHDIGKIGVPETILKFPGKLTEEMRNVIREHPRLGAQLVMKFPTLELALPVIRYHHERWDGTGYPHGKHRRDIPLVARIFAVVDALEALTSQRPYKDALPIEDVTDILIKDSGSHFDPTIVDAYLAVPMAEWMRLREQEHLLASSSYSRPAA